jgi:hypothetical protein
MFCLSLGVLITLAGIGALLWLAWRGLIRYLRANPDAVKALADNLSVLVGEGSGTAIRRQRWPGPNQPAGEHLEQPAMMTYRCPRCRRLCRAKPAWLGKTVLCLGCGKKMVLLAILPGGLRRYYQRSRN